MREFRASLNSSESFVLGTAQAKAGYGITRKSQQDQYAFRTLLTTANQLGISWLDTAQNYGEAEQWIGDAPGFNFKVSSKVALRGTDIDTLKKSVEKSIRALGAERLQVVFAHDWETASVLEQKAFIELKKEFPHLKLGLSIYDPQTLEILLNSLDIISLFQVPLNLLNQSFIALISKCKSYGIEIWARSIFLQGVLDYRLENNPFSQHNDIKRFRTFCHKHALSPIEAAISFVINTEVNMRIFGVDNSDQLRELYRLYNLNHDVVDFRELASTDQDLIDPRRWKR